MSEHTPTPWLYRPYRYDDWGYIRTPPTGTDEVGDVVAVARAGQYLTEDEKNAHRAAKTDPFGPNALFIVQACNSHDPLVYALGGLIEAVERDSKDNNSISGYTGARLSDARAAFALATTTAPIPHHGEKP